MDAAPAWADTAFRSACVELGIDATEATFLRVGTYATWLVPNHNLVARVAGPEDADLVAREYQVALALQEANVPAAQPARPAHSTTTGTVGWWELGVPTEATWLQLGSAARTLHERSGAWLLLGNRCPVICNLVAQAEGRFERAYALLPDLHPELDFARKRLADAATKLDASKRAKIVIAHGDLSPHNVLSDGRLIDLETAGVGEPAIDLARVADAVERYGEPLETLQAFADGYGCDLAAFADPRVQIWMEIRDLWAAAWAAACANRTQQIAHEARRRLSTLTDMSETWALI
jgi:aminoglycoside phosphotransferase (APT) family kinase protein